MPRETSPSRRFRPVTHPLRLHKPRLLRRPRTRLLRGTTTPPPAPRSGYWMVSDGVVYPFGGAKSYGSAPVSGVTAVDLEPTPSGNGYWIVDDLGRVYRFGDAVHHGNVDRTRLAVGEKVTSLRPPMTAAATGSSPAGVGSSPSAMPRSS